MKVLAFWVAGALLAGAARGGETDPAILAEVVDGKLLLKQWFPGEPLPEEAAKLYVPPDGFTIQVTEADPPAIRIRHEDRRGDASIVAARRFFLVLHEDGVRRVGGVLRLPAAPGVFVARVYDMADLVSPADRTPRAADLEPLVDLITATVAPGTWAGTEPGGVIGPSSTDGRLMVLHTEAVHEQVADRLRQLRRLHAMQTSGDPGADDAGRTR